MKVVPATPSRKMPASWLPVLPTPELKAAVAKPSVLVL
ncbi:hypothetical protein MKSMC1_15300 [Mycobacterium kansasii]|nr:hypothetical protein MKSMC1_15300 [Mycobacterium kansasii]